MDEPTEFGGVVGHVLQRSFSLGTLISGIALCVIMGLQIGSSLLTDTVRLGFGMAETVLAIALARFAVNGFHGQWGGTVFSTEGSFFFVNPSRSSST